MKNYFIIVFFLLPLYLISQTRKGKVVRVADGDTITILDSTNTQLRVRLYGVDAPEKGQDFSNVAKQFISDLCFSKIVSIDIKDIDRYGRTVGIVWTADSTNLNLELLRSGLAWHYKIFDNSDDFAQAEHLARINKVGLWREPNAAPPWEFRRKK
ncbi:thermonuclease family protein [Sphingobacterium kitahiroshimense]|uniref:thermonuclease family protein n=1 Tax=Sphingobacterium sp. B16(2022) TaxID=2914044 RepID=UPI00143959F7|nr:thermonuclease family protein [Sphingobacterium sp. B16(2022)]NJI71956.1 thermonuclease family protein [Sphingobacterium sp. B16(2022)]